MSGQKIAHVHVSIWHHVNVLAILQQLRILIQRK